MTETSTTTASTTAEALRTIADLLDAATIPPGAPQIHWHFCDDDTLRQIMAAFPDATWRPMKSAAGTEWIQAQVGNVNLTAFAADPTPRPTPRLQALFTDQPVSA